MACQKHYNIRRIFHFRQRYEIQGVVLSSMSPSHEPCDSQQHLSCRASTYKRGFKNFSQSSSVDPEVRYHPTELFLVVSLSKQSLESTHRSQTSTSILQHQSVFVMMLNQVDTFLQDSPRTFYSTIPRPTCCSSLSYIDSYATGQCPRIKSLIFLYNNHNRFLKRNRTFQLKQTCTDDSDNCL